MSDDLIAITTQDELPKDSHQPTSNTVADEASTSPRATPTISSGGLFSPYATAHINASPQTVYDALVDAAGWKQWNTFVPSVTVKPPSGSTDTNNIQQHASMTFKVTMSYGNNTVSKEYVNILDPRPGTTSRKGSITRICWILDNKSLLTPRFLMHAERVNEIEDCGDGTCIYRTWETFGGAVARIVKWKYESLLKERFKDWVKDLKGYVEKNEAIKNERSSAIEMPA